MRTATMILLFFALAPTSAAAGTGHRATWWIARAPKAPVPPQVPAAPGPPRMIVIKSGANGRTWSVPTRKRAFLGVQLLHLTNELRVHFGVDDNIGVMISKVEKDTPAAAAKLQVGDVLVAIDGQPVGSAQAVVRAIRTKNDGDRVELNVMRKGKKRTLQVTLSVRETPQIDLSGLFHLKPGGGEMHLEVEGEDVDIPLPPMPQIQELRDHFMKLRDNHEVFKHLEKEKKLEKRLRELEDKLLELEKKLQGKVRKTSDERDAWVPISSTAPRLA